MNSDELARGAALLAAAKNRSEHSLLEECFAYGQEHGKLLKWLHAHAAELLALAKCIEAAKALRADYYEAGICCDGGRAMREFDAAIDAARASGADEPCATPT